MGGFGLPNAGFSQNQYGPYPPSNPSYGTSGLPNPANPDWLYPSGTVPPATSTASPVFGAGAIAGINVPGRPPTTAQPAGTGQVILPISPGFTQEFGQWLAQQMGAGATPFNLSAGLPTGGATGPGQLSAPMNPVLAQLQQFLTGGNASGIPGLDTLSQMSKTGMPVDQTQAWKAMVDSMQRQIGQGAEGLREQFAFSGNLASSPFGQAMTDYYGQTEKDLNAQLLAAQTGALEAARGRQMQAGGELTQLQTDLGQVFQGMDQASIDRLIQEFVRTRPEYGPLLNAMFGFSTTFPPYAAQSYGIGGLGALLGGAGALAGGIGDIMKAWPKSTPTKEGG